MSYVLTDPATGDPLPVRAPVRRPTALAAPLLVVVSFAVAAPLAVLLTAATAGHDPEAVLVVLCAAALAVGWIARPASSAVVGVVFWLFLDGFVIHHDGVLGWTGAADATRLGLLVGCGVVGSLLGAVIPLLRSAAAALRSTRRRFRRASLEPFAPVFPPRGHPSYWN